jgi:hypothetical protein
MTAMFLAIMTISVASAAVLLGLIGAVVWLATWRPAVRRL